MRSKSDAFAWFDRWRTYEVTREVFVTLLVDGEPPDGKPEDISPEKFERAWRVACGRIGLSQAAAEEMRDPEARGNRMRRALTLMRVSRSMRRKIDALLRQQLAFDARFARWRVIAPVIG